MKDLTITRSLSTSHEATARGEARKIQTEKLWPLGMEGPKGQLLVQKSPRHSHSCLKNRHITPPARNKSNINFPK